MQIDWSRVELDAGGWVVETERGVRCGSCKRRHSNADSVKACYAHQAEARSEIEAELAAEARNERYFEERGHYEALAQEDYEARMGVVPFHVAYAESF